MTLISVVKRKWPHKPQRCLLEALAAGGGGRKEGGDEEGVLVYKCAHYGWLSWAVVAPMHPVYSLEGPGALSTQPSNHFYPRHFPNRNGHV